MELIDRIRQMLKTEYGINSEEELTQALKRQQELDIGIFVSSCGMTDKTEEKPETLYAC